MPINNTLPPTNIPAGVTKQTKKTTGVSGSWGAPANPVKKSAPVAGVMPTPTTSAYTPPSVNQNTQRGIVPLSAPITKPQNITTPSGMQVSGNPGTWTGGQPAQEQKFNQPVQGLFGNVAQSLANRSYEGSPELNSVAEQLRQSAAANEAIGQRAAKIAEEYGKQYANVGRLGANAEAGYISTGISPVAQGSAAVIARNTAAQQQAIAQGMQAALEGTGQQLTAQQQLSAALNQAGGLYGQQQQLTQSGLESAGSLTQPQLGQYGQTYYSPTGGASSGGAYSNLDPQTQAMQLGQLVANGQMGLTMALSQMTGGAAAAPLLRAAILRNNPDFNFAQADSLAEQQGTIIPAYNFADRALQNVENAIAGLSGGLGFAQGTNIPLVNTIGDFVSTQSGVGSKQTRELTGAVQTLRNAYAALLAGARGGTPTDYSAQAAAEIPDFPTPNDIAALKANMQNLGQARVNIYSNPGSNTQNNYNDITPYEERALLQQGFTQDEINALKKQSFNQVGNTSVSIPPTSRLASVNNNPGNLKYAGQKGAVLGEKGFARFESPEAGIKALQDQINLDASRGLTLAQFINKYAPPSENDTQKYIKDVAMLTGAQKNTPIKNIDLRVLTQAIAKKESNTIIS